MALLTSNTVAIGPQTTQVNYIKNVFAVLKWPCAWWWIFTSRGLWAFFLSIIVIYNYSISFTKTNNYEYLKLLNISVENGNLKKATIPSSITCSWTPSEYLLRRLVHTRFGCLACSAGPLPGQTFGCPRSRKGSCVLPSGAPAVGSSPPGSVYESDRRRGVRRRPLHHLHKPNTWRGSLTTLTLSFLKKPPAV